jgi:maleylacetate reductase
MLVRSLPRVKADPGDLDARLQCQLATCMAAGLLGQGVPFGASHAIGHVLGGTAAVPHGHTSCVMLPHVLEFNSQGLCDAPGGADGSAVVNGISLRSALRATAEAFGGAASASAPAPAAAAAADAFIRGLGLPRTLAEVGVADGLLDTIAQLAMRDPWTATNPRPIDGPAAVRAILHAAQTGVVGGGAGAGAASGSRL